MIPDKYKVYLKEGHRNEVIYRSKDTVVDERLKTVIEDAVFIYDLFIDTDYAGAEASRLFSRMLGEQGNQNKRFRKYRSIKRGLA